jgi:HEPN domain-containing protein
MTKNEKYGYWIMLSNYDLDTTDCLVAGERWVYVAYLCQQALERQLKGMYVYYCDAEAPKTHNVSFLLSRVTAAPRFKAEADQARFALRRDECEDLMADAMFYYMSDYPFSYKNITSRFVDEQVAAELLAKTRDFIAWLRSFQPETEIPTP